MFLGRVFLATYYVIDRPPLYGQSQIAREKRNEVFHKVVLEDAWRWKGQGKVGFRTSRMGRKPKHDEHLGRSDAMIVIQHSSLMSSL